MTTPMIQSMAEIDALLEKATDEDLSDGGRYFDESFDDLTRCRHEEVGEYQNRHDGALIEWLWNHRLEIRQMYAALAADAALHETKDAVGREGE